MLHIYAVVLAVVLLVGALAAIIICVCVDIVPIIKSRGSTLVSRDSVTQEQTRMLKKSLQLKRLSASVDLIDTVHGRRNTLAQALIKSGRPRFGSTPLSLLTGSGEKDSDVQIKTTTVIMEALPKKSPLAENNNNNDVSNVESDVTNSQKEETLSDGQTPYSNRSENLYIQTKISKLTERRSKSEGSPNVNGRRTKSVELLDDGNESEVRRGAMTYNPRVTMETEVQTRSYPNSPNVRTSRSMQTKQDNTMSSSQEQRPDSGQSGSLRTPTSHTQLAVRSKLYPRYGNSPSCNRDCPSDETRILVDSNGVPIENATEIPSQNCDSGHCKWCQVERDRNSRDRARERPLPIRRSESFPENYQGNSSPRMSHNLPRQHSFNDQVSGSLTRGFPYDHNKFCKGPHRGYSPCPDCFHQPYYYTNQGEGSSPTFSMQNPGVGNPPKGGGTPLPGQLNVLLSSSSSSSSSGSSSRFRHLRQPLEDIQEDASDCYANRDAEVTSTFDSRELDSSPDDDTMPKSTENSCMSVSPLILTEKQTAMVSASES